MLTNWKNLKPGPLTLGTETQHSAEYNSREIFITVNWGCQDHWISVLAEEECGKPYIVAQIGNTAYNEFEEPLNPKPKNIAESIEAWLQQHNPELKRVWRQADGSYSFEAPAPKPQ